MHALDQFAAETRDALAGLARVQAGAADQLAALDQRQAAASESIRAELAAVRAQLAEAARTSAGQHEDALRRMHALDQFAAETRDALAGLARVQAGAADQLAALDQRQAAVSESIRAELAAVRAQLAEAAGQGRALLAGVNETVAALQTHVAHQQQADEEMLESLRQQLVVLAGRLAAFDAALSSADVEGRLDRQDQRLRALEADPTAGAEFEDFYLAFENRYRGSLQEITARQKTYLPYFEALGVTGASHRPGARVADLGCGRGEWLELLLQSGATGAIGVDRGLEMINFCHQRGLPVEQSDALEFLRRQPNGSHAAITAFHLVEHLPFPVLLAILREARRVLEPGGLLVLETPNCGNLIVASQSFHLDPTHRLPIPPMLLSFSVEHAGFREIKTLLLHPYGSESRVADFTPLADRFNEFFYGPQDYAVLASNA